MSKIPAAPNPFWGSVNGQPLKIRTMASTGDFGTGKTLLGAMIDPYRTLVMDLESSASSLNLPFKTHRIMYDEVPIGSGRQIPTPEESFIWWRDGVMAIEPGEYTVVMTDPINEIQQGCYDFIYNNPDMFGRTKGQYDKMTAMVWGDVKVYLDQLVGQLSRKIETFYYTLHIGQKWVGGKPVEGKKGVRAKGSDVFRKMADLLFVLDRPVDPATGKMAAKPRGLCTGTIGKSRLSHANPATGEVIPILPPMVTNLDPARIRFYVANPPTYRTLLKHEKVEIQEMSDDDRLEIKREIAEAERDTEEMKSTRIDRAAVAQARNLASRQESSDLTSAEQAMQNAVEPVAKEPADHNDERKPEAVDEKASVAVTQDMPTQSSQTDASAAGMNIARADRKEIIIEGAKKLWGKDARKNLEATLKRRGAAKFDDLSDEQVVDVHQAIHDALIKKKSKN